MDQTRVTLRVHSLVTLTIVLAAALGAFSLGTYASPDTQPAATSISFTITTTTNYPMTTGGTLQVTFNSVQLVTQPPQVYSFGAVAKTSPGFWITRLYWQFGDGSFRDVPYCCQSQVSEVQHHGYENAGTYTVTVIAYDNAGNFGTATVTVDWPTPIPEYPFNSLPLLASIIIALIGATSIRRRLRRQ